MQWPMVKGMGYRLLWTIEPIDGIVQRTDFASALKGSRQSGKPVLLDFAASWYPPCQAMKHDAWPDARLRRAVTDRYTPVALGADDASNSVVAERYGVDTIPRIIVVYSDGEVLTSGTYMARDALWD